MVRFLLLCLIGIFGASTAQAAPVLNAANGHYYESVTVAGGISWSAASAAANARTHQGLNGHLVDISSQAENDFILGNLPTAISGNYWIGGYQDPAGGDYSEPGGGWRWTTGQPFTYTNWQTNEPNNIEAAENQIQILSNGKWNDAVGAANLGGYIVEYDNAAALPTPTPLPTGAPVFNPGNGNYYQAVVATGGITWEQARTAASAATHQGLSGHLVAINSPAENQFIVSNLPTAISGSYWIGGAQDRSASDFSEPSSGWRWVTGETWAYTNWEFNEPNNGQALEDFAHFLTNGKWNDVRGTMPLGGYVIEFEGPDPVPSATPIYNPSNGHYYEAIGEYDLIDWHTARADAAARLYQGRVGHLVTITSAAERDFINTNFPAARSNQYWIGAYQDRNAPVFSEPGGGWRWITDEPWSFTNWGSGEPNNAYGASPPEDNIFLLTDGRWVDARGGSVTGGYLVEYDGPIPLYQISGRVSNAQGQAIAGARVSRAGISSFVLTNTAGYYTIPNVQPGTYTVNISKSGYSFTPATRSVSTLNGSVANQNFIGRTGVTLSGRISTSSGVAIGGVTVTRTGSATPVTTNSAGYYTFVDVQPGSITLTPSRSGYRFTPVNKTVTVGSTNISGQNFIGATGYSLSGRIVNGAGTGVANVSVLRSGSNVAAITNSAGYYTFVDVPNGSYTVTPGGSGLSFTPEFRTATISGANVGNLNFSTATGYSIIGRITSSDGAPLSGVMVTRTGSGTPVFTNSAGYFVFNGVASGRYTLLPSADNTDFTPVTRTVDVNGATASGQNFIAMPQ